eukprot:307924-Chlamydomonas_euryale.AAC.7
MGPLTARLRQQMTSVVNAGRENRFKNWLLPPVAQDYAQRHILCGSAPCNFDSDSDSDFYHRVGGLTPHLC